MAKNDNVVIFGGSGFIGQHLVKELQNKVESITVVSRRVKDGFIDNTGVKYRQGDIQDPNTAINILKGASVVYDLSKPLGENWGDFDKRCIESVKNMAEGALKNNLRKVIYTSTSDAVYLGANKIVTEMDGTDRKPHLRNTYSRGKATAEKILLDYYHKKNLPVTIFRPFLVVGKGKNVTHGGIGHWKAPNCLVGWGKGNYKQPFILVQDLVNAMVLGMDAMDVDGKTFNIAGDVCITAREYVELLSKSSKRNFRFYPQNLMKLAMIEVITKSIKRIMGKREERQTYRDMVSASKRSTVDCSAAKNLLGWKPNSDFSFFRSEAIDSYFYIPPGDLRL